MSERQPFLVAHVCGDKVHWDIAYETEDGGWETINGWEVWPFYTEAFEQPTPDMPEGWIEHLEAEASRLFKPQRTAKLNLTALIPPSTPIRRRI